MDTTQNEVKASEIDIEQIMADIRQEIKDNGYTDDMLSFDDIIVDSAGLTVEKFDQNGFTDGLDTMNATWSILGYRDLGPTAGIKSKITVFIKKVIRKLTTFYVQPIVEDQSRYNANVTRSMNYLNCYIQEKEQENKELKEQIKKLEERLLALEQSNGAGQ